jgi:hypothetical protein
MKKLSGEDIMFIIMGIIFGIFMLSVTFLMIYTTITGRC